MSNKVHLHTVYFICELLYMYRVVSPPIIRSTNNCIYSIWLVLVNSCCYLSPSWFQVVKVPRLRDNDSKWWEGCQPYAPAVFTSRKYSWYSFLLETESNPGP